MFAMAFPIGIYEVAKSGGLQVFPTALIVHFANFFRYMEAAEHAFLRSLGLSVVMDIDGGKYGLPRVSASCDYLKPARLDETI